MAVTIIRLVVLRLFKLLLEYNNYMANWYTSEPHFNHYKINAFCRRPYRTTKEMNVTLGKPDWENHNDG